MKNLYIFFVLLLLMNNGLAQDIIYKKDGSAIICKVKAITIDVIKYKRNDIRNSPIFEVKISDAYKVKFIKGNKESTEILDPVFYKNNEDTIHYSLVYVVNRSNKNISLGIDGNEEIRVKNHSRLILKFKREREKRIYTISTFTQGPKLKFVPIHGQNYAIYIQEKELTLYKDPKEVAEFIKKEFYGFSPDYDHNLYWNEK